MGTAEKDYKKDVTSNDPENLKTFEEIKDQIADLQPLGEGWRGAVFKGVWRNKKVTVKVAKRKEVEKAINREAEVLKILKGMRGFPQLLDYGRDFIIYEFIEGVTLDKFKGGREERKAILLRILDMALLLDRLNISKDEFHDLRKNVLVNRRGEVFLIDFERAKFTKKPSNLTQFLQFLVRSGVLDLEEAVELGKRYKRGGGEGVYDKVKEAILRG